MVSGSVPFLLHLAIRSAAAPEGTMRLPARRPMAWATWSTSGATGIVGTGRPSRDSTADHRQTFVQIENAPLMHIDRLAKKCGACVGCEYSRAVGVPARACPHHYGAPFNPIASPGHTAPGLLQQAG